MYTGGFLYHLEKCKVWCEFIETYCSSKFNIKNGINVLSKIFGVNSEIYVVKSLLIGGKTDVQNIFEANAFKLAQLP